VKTYPTSAGVAGSWLGKQDESMFLPKKIKIGS